jgi:hypothetical protein
MSVGLYISAVAFVAATLVPLVLAAVQVRRVALPGWSGPPARVAEAVVAIGLTTLVAQVLGAVGLLERVPLVVLSLMVGIGATWALRRRGPGPQERLPAPPPDPLAVGLALGAVALVCGAWVARVEASLEGGMIGVDTLWYHLPAAARFAQEGSIAHVHFFDGEPVTAYYPANSSLLHAVGMVLTKRDLVSPVMNLGWLALALVSAWSIGRPRGRGPEAVLASAVLLGTPTIVTTQPGEGYNDVVGVALLLAAGALIVNADGRRVAFALAGVAAGVGLGAKFTMVAPAVALTLGVVLLAPRGRRLASAASFGLITLAFGGYWYARNLFAVGNPLPAADLSLGPLTLPSPEIGTPTYTVAQYLFDGRVWDDYFLPGLDFAFGPSWWAMLALAVAGMLLALVQGPTRAHRLLGLVALLTAGSFVFTPQFLGVDGAPVFFRFNLRYVSPALVLGLVLLPLAPGLDRIMARRALALALGAVLVAAQVDSGIWPSRADRAAVAAAAIVLAAGVLAVVAKRGVMPAAPRVAAGLAATVITLIAGYAMGDRYLTDRYRPAAVTDAVLPREIYGWARDARDTRIALSNMFLQYPLAGMDLSNRVQYLGLSRPDGGFAPPRDCREWRAALADGGYRYVVTAPRGYPAQVAAEDPPEAEWTRTAAGASEVVTDAGSVRLFRLGRPPDPEGCVSGS